MINKVLSGLLALSIGAFFTVVLMSDDKQLKGFVWFVGKALQAIYAGEVSL